MTGFSGADVWPDWITNDLDQASRPRAPRGVDPRASLTSSCGRGRTAPRGRRSRAPRQVATLTDPGSRRVVAACKRWETATSTELVIYQPDEITRYSAPGLGATTTGFRVVETHRATRSASVPVVALQQQRTGCWPSPAQRDGRRARADRRAEQAHRSTCSSHSRVHRPPAPLGHRDRARRGRRPANEVNPIPETNRAMISENPDAKFGSLAGSDLAGYENAIGVIMREISAVSGLPGAHARHRRRQPHQRRQHPRVRGRAHRPRRGTTGDVRTSHRGRRPPHGRGPDRGRPEGRRRARALGRRRHPLRRPGGRRRCQAVQCRTAARLHRAGPARLFLRRDRRPSALRAAPRPSTAPGSSSTGCSRERLHRDARPDRRESRRAGARRLGVLAGRPDHRGRVRRRRGRVPDRCRPPRHRPGRRRPHRLPDAPPQAALSRLWGRFPRTWTTGLASGNWWPLEPLASSGTPTAAGPPSRGLRTPTAKP